MKTRLLLVCFLCTLSAGTLCAQDSRGAITGSVTDAQGASVPATRIEAKNLDTNIVYPTVTTGAGVYSIPLIPAGNYSVSATHEGFKSSIQPRIEVRTGDRVQADFKLEVGAVSQELTISSEAPLLDAATASRGQVISSEAIENTPVMGRNIAMLATLAPGVQIPTGRADIQNVYDGTIDQLSINGGRTGRNNFTVNGMPDVSQEGATANSTAAAIPPPEAVSEVRVQTSEYSAENGHTGGGTINVNIKGGTNQVHGVAYEYWRNDALNANLFNQNANGIARTIFKWNQPGTELVGPVYIPRVYDGRNKTFFMFSWEEHRNTLPLPVTSTVPTVQQRAGDFSGTTANGLPVIIYDPLNVVNGVRQPFPNNIIPSGRINPIGGKLLSLFPQSTGSGDRDHNNNFVLAPYPDRQQYDVFSAQVDHNLNASNRLSTTVIRSNRHETRNTSAYVPVESSPDYIHWRINHNSSVNWTSTINPTTVFSLRAGYTRRQFAIARHSAGYDITTLGFPASLRSQLPASFFPNISETGYLGLGSANSSYSFSNDYIVQASVTKLINRHSLKLGGQIENMRDNYSTPGAINFSFSSVFTQQRALTANTNQGNPIASLLLGYPTSGGVPYNVSPAYGSRYYAVYLQDDWRVNSRLTLNLGIRWDLETPRTERYNRQNAGFDSAAASPFRCRDTTSRVVCSLRAPVTATRLLSIRTTSSPDSARPSKLTRRQFCGVASRDSSCRRWAIAAATMASV